MSKNIRMIVTDLDGSLLHTDKTISGYSRDIFGQCRKENIIIAFATARQMRSTKLFEEEINPNAVIYSNGAIITAEKEILHKYSIGFQEARRTLLRIMEMYPECTWSVASNNTMYANHDMTFPIENRKISFNELPEHDVDQIYLGNISVEKIRKIRNFIGDGLFLEIMDGYLGYITSKQASKWNGVHELSGYYKVEKEEIAAFGDDLNDLDMIKNSGTGIAVDNARSEVKWAAGHICENNDYDGIAKWIEKNIL